MHAYIHRENERDQSLNFPQSHKRSEQTKPNLQDCIKIHLRMHDSISLHKYKHPISEPFLKVQVRIKQPYECRSETVMIE